MLRAPGSLELPFFLLISFMVSCAEKRPPMARIPEAEPAPSADTAGETSEKREFDLAESESLRLRKEECARPPESVTFKLARPILAAESGLKVSPEKIMSKVMSACGSCHAPKIGVGGFRLVESYESQTLVIDDTPLSIPGFQTSAPLILEFLEDGSMPPGPKTEAQKESLRELATELESWIAEGLPAPGQLASREALPQMWGEHAALDAGWTPLGDCIPNISSLQARFKAALVDTEKDSFFAEANELPSLLSSTDLFTLDHHLLAEKGTFSYDVEYPLWNDYAKKLRHIHVPALEREEENQIRWQPQAVTLLQDPEFKNHEYNFPNNTRFYKTFFAQKRNQKGETVFRPMETRVIVVRKNDEPLFGTYVWREDYSDADLLQDPYRDGTPWKDRVVRNRFDETRPDSFRDYPIPAKHRCVQCHMGTEEKSFVLGFAPYQLNLRKTDPLGQSKDLPSPWLSQIDRLHSAGILSEEASRFRPKLEELPRKENYETHQDDKWPLTVTAQSYLFANCAHCHNPSGYAYTEGEIKFDLRPGRATEFPTHLKPTKFNNDNLKLVSSDGNLEISHLFRRVAGDESELRGQERMPLHTPGSPDCKSVETIGQWILAHNPNLKAEQISNSPFSKPCSTEEDFSRTPVHWIEEDPTSNENAYIPRRADWKNPTTGMDSRYFALPYTSSLQDLAAERFPTGWWLNVDGACHFPEPPDTEAKLKEYDSLGMTWIRRGVMSRRSPKTLGQLYVTTAGAHFFSQTCVKCHGRLGQGDGVIAKDFRQITPANFVTGMFGNQGENLQHFEVTEPDGKTVNYSPQYFVWMAMEGTRLREIPPAAQDLVGKYEGRMLGQIRDHCFRLLTGEKKLARDFLLYQKVCTWNSLNLEHPDLTLDATFAPLHPDKVESWLDHAAQNAGFLIYEYVKEQLAKGRFQPTQGECELIDDFTR